MILDTLENCHCYASLHPLFKKAFSFLQETANTALPDGRVSLDDDRVFALIQSYETQATGEGKLEAHQRYIDIQYVLAGQEQIGYAPTRELTPVKLYDTEKDFALYKGDALFFRLQQGMFAIFYPNDAHQPCQPCNHPESVRKIVIKVAV